VLGDKPKNQSHDSGGLSKPIYHYTYVPLAHMRPRVVAAVMLVPSRPLSPSPPAAPRPRPRPHPQPLPSPARTLIPSRPSYTNAPHLRRTSLSFVPPSHLPSVCMGGIHPSAPMLEERALFTDDRIVCRSSTGSRPSAKGEEGRCVRSALMLASTSS
jgi:hypothetical protein